MRRALPIVVVVAVLAGCGGSKQSKDPGREAFRSLVRAAAAGDEASVRALLTPDSHVDVGALRRRLRPFRGGYTLVVSERITDTPPVGLVAAVHGGSSFAAALRQVGEEWRFELGGPIRIRPLGPAPGARQARVRQLAAAIDGTQGAGGGEALLYLDGIAAPDAKVYRFAKQLSIVSNLPVSAPKGVHSVVVFAAEGAHATARAWTFTVPA
jgi:hypothetical protein